MASVFSDTKLRASRKLFCVNVITVEYRLLRTYCVVSSERCSLTHFREVSFMRGRILFAALFLAVVPTAASAQIGVGAGVGAAFPTGDFGDAVDPGLHVQASLNIGLPMLPDFRLDGIYQTYSGDGDTSVDVLGGGVNVLLDMPLVVIKPYLIAGVGFYDVSVEAGTVDESNSEIGFTGGAGLRLGLGSLGVFAEARVLRIGGDADMTTVPVLVGITF